MKWDRKGALKALKAEKCSVCQAVKPVYVVVTMHGKKDLHFPCCSQDCADIVGQIMLEEQQQKFGF